MVAKPIRLRNHEEVLAEQLKDPEFREHWERTALARAVALRILTYRVEHGLSQTQLAKLLGVKQPAIARLESGEHNPSMETLYHLSRNLGNEFLVDIAPGGRRRPWITRAAEKAAVVEKFTAADGSQVLIVAA